MKKLIIKYFIKKILQKLWVWIITISIFSIIFSKYFFIFLFFILIRFLIKEFKFYTTSLLPSKDIKLTNFKNFSYYYYYLDINFDDNEIKFNNDGISFFDYGYPIGKKITPTHVSFVSLMYLQKYLKNRNSNYYYKVYKNHVEWIKNKYIDLGFRGYVWVFNFDWKEGCGVLRAPWFSALSQGLVVSVLIRNYLIFGDEESFMLAKKAVEIFEFDVPFGVRYVENNFWLYEEYPILPPVHILDGFLISLLGLYDLVVVSSEEKHKKLFYKGIEGLEYKLPYYDYKRMWSIFGGHNLLSSTHYNLMNSKLLEVMYKVTNNRIFLLYSNF